MPAALLIGHEGQDGTYLAELLRRNGYSVTGTGRRSTQSDRMNVAGRSFDVTNRSDMSQLLREIRPDEIYYLAALHHSSEDPQLKAQELISASIAVNALGLNNVLGAVVSESPASRVFYASSSRIFGAPDSLRQDEQTPFRPLCAYGISKVAGMSICQYYRSVHGVFAASGILYNHESPLRPDRFISKKIVRAAVSIARGATEQLVIGDLNAEVDWGYAPDYARAMWKILQLDRPSDFVIGTGILHSVRDFVQAAFEQLGLDWKEHVVQNQCLLNRAAPKGVLCADSSKLRESTAWRPEVDFRQMVRIMVDAERQSYEWAQERN